jgi:Amt family ammonium transporter
MTPALALFYGGMVRRGNVLSTMLHSFIMMGVVSVVWLVVGYSLAFGPSRGLIGGLDYAFGAVSMTKPYNGQTVPAGAFMLFQMMFAVITPALISGAIAERMKFGAYLLFTTLWSLLVYVPVACWVWNPNGWLNRLGALDFAGGTVVHLASGSAALAACIVLGKRRALVHREPIVPNNLTTTLLGAGLLWFGWIGFNAGSALAINDIAINAFIATHVAAAGGMLGWLTVERFKSGKPTALGAASGLVAGLVGITPAAGFATPASAVLIGLATGAVCCFAVAWKNKLGYDDALDVVGVHGVGGALGALLTGVFATTLVNPAVADSLKNGRAALLEIQALAVVLVGAFSFVMAAAIMKFTQWVAGLRPDSEDEDTGLDLALHGEVGYNL